MSAPTVLIMAAGEGTRMRSKLPKVLHPVCGRPMVSWPILAAREAGAGRIAVIVSSDRDISPALPDGVETVVQPEPDGTGGALRSATELIDGSGTVVVLSGDHPLVSAEVISALLEAHRSSGAAATVMTTDLDDPGSYGRIVRDGSGDVERIVEAKPPTDATPDELAIREINTGTYVFESEPLADALGRITNDNSQGEYFLGDVLPVLRASGLRVAAHREPDAGVNLGINDRADLALATAETRRRILVDHMRAGVTIIDPAATWIDAGIEIEPDAIVEPGCSLRGATRVGRGSVIGPHSTVIDSTIGAGASVVHSYLVDCEVLDGCTVGPFTYLRPETRLGEGAKAGAFVEIKKSRIGEGAKVPHLSYIGDAEIGEDANIGAGTITANYDGIRKHRTVIGDHVRIGVDTSLVAPVNIGDAAYTGAGSVITSDVPPGALGITRPRQENIEGYTEKRAKEANEEGTDS
ncbi:MAG TPA: bifunctional UDP-N-acetylglucosamine diphosphorylase/glucosamine-1-phosphate N-acetyltransferase GlmU [Solirubrobacterales bacterium]|nr:bifunctional UDP-N-acetylglucosamine diphosphorylase/glucosamine-1-phosphate N-acetyltransferase GlmU [Solirubrobacterales bacterium]